MSRFYFSMSSTALHAVTYNCARPSRHSADASVGHPPAHFPTSIFSPPENSPWTFPPNIPFRTIAPEACHGQFTTHRRFAPQNIPPNNFLRTEMARTRPKWQESRWKWSRLKWSYSLDDTVRLANRLITVSFCFFRESALCEYDMLPLR